MHAAMLNRATLRVADTTEVSGRVTTGSVKNGLYAKKQSSLRRIGGLTVFDLLLAFAVSLVTSGFVLSANASERKTTIITFDVPGASTGSSQGTQAFAISPNGTITGQYFDSGGVLHGFVRARDGTFITFDAPGAGTASGQGTIGISINPAGTIAGFYFDASNVIHGFVRAPNGAITTFDAPGAGTAPGPPFQGTFAGNINPAGVIAGDYADASNVIHGFVRAPNGAITTFDAPGAGTAPGQGTATAFAMASTRQVRLLELTPTRERDSRLRARS
jgi:hypothetical protein